MQPPSDPWWNRLFGRGERRGRPAHVCPALELRSDRAVDRAAAWLHCVDAADSVHADEAIAHVQDALRPIHAAWPHRLLELDRALRARSHPLGRGFYACRTHDELDPLVSGERRPILRVLALGHPSGYVREGAVHDAAERLSRGETVADAALVLGLLLLRCNDWVDPVALAAQQHVMSLAAGEPPPGWLEGLSVLDHLRQGTRRDLSGVLAAVDAWCRSAPWAATLRASIEADDRHTLAAVSRAMSCRGLDPGDILDRAFSSRGPGVRLRAARTLRDPSRAYLAEGVLDRLEDDTCTAMRRESLWLRSMNAPHTLQAAYARLIWDPSAGLRHEAQDARRRKGEDPAPAYRKALSERDSSATRVRTALLGLARLGRTEDATLAWPYLQHPVGRTRAAAIRCIAAHAPGQHLDRLLAALQDPVLAVVRAAVDALDGRVSRTDAPVVAAGMEHGRHMTGRRLQAQLLLSCMPWDALPHIVRRAADAVDGPAWAWRLLAAWIARNSGWTRGASAAQREAIVRAVDEGAGSMPERLHRELAFLARTLS